MNPSFLVPVTPQKKCQNTQPLGFPPTLRIWLSSPCEHRFPASLMKKEKVKFINYMQYQKPEIPSCLTREGENFQVINQ